jgi:hypothetical protein
MPTLFALNMPHLRIRVTYLEIFMMLHATGETFQL